MINSIDHPVGSTIYLVEPKTDAKLTVGAGYAVVGWASITNVVVNDDEGWPISLNRDRFIAMEPIVVDGVLWELDAVVIAKE